MDRKTRAHSVQTIVLTFLCCLTWTFVPQLSQAVLHETAITLNIHERISDVPLTNENILKLDSTIENPGYTRYALERVTQALDLSIRKNNESHFYEPALGGFNIEVTRYFRKGPQWYQLQDEFPCPSFLDAFTDRFFQTFELVQEIAKTESSAWVEMIKNKAHELEWALKKAHGSTEIEARYLAELAISKWIGDLEDVFIRIERPRIAHDSRIKHQMKWKKYGCRKRKIEWPPNLRTQAEPAEYQAPITRSPARLWDGRPVIRIGVYWSDKRLSGQFLIDPSAKFSSVDPLFLKKQGIPPSLISNKIYIQQLQMSNFNLDAGWMMITPSQKFNSERYLQACCDGVIGMDRLKPYIVEFFDSGKEVSGAVQLWSSSTWKVPPGLTPKRWSGEEDSQLYRSRQGSVFFDYLDGWMFAPDNMSLVSVRSPVLKTEFSVYSGIRVLVVLDIPPSEYQKKLLASGLLRGALITQINGRPVDEIDSWEVEQLWTLQRSERLTIQYSSKKEKSKKLTIN